MKIGHKIYPIKYYVNCWYFSVTLTFEVGRQVLGVTHRLFIVTMLIFDLQLWPWPWRKVTDCCAWHIVSLLWTFVASIYKIPSKIRKLRTGHDIHPQKDNVYLEWASVTLEVGVWLLRMTNRHIIINFCAKLFQSFGPDTIVWRTEGRPTFGVYVLFPWSLCGIFLINQ
jgi:hypothetical protein